MIDLENSTIFVFVDGANFIDNNLADKYVIFFDTYCGKTSLENLLCDSEKIVSDLQDGNCYILFFYTDVVEHQFNTDDLYWTEFREVIKDHNIKRIVNGMKNILLKKTWNRNGFPTFFLV